MDRIVLSRPQFADLLADFVNEVKNNGAKKLDYDLWRQLSAWARNDCYSDIIIDRNAVYEYIIQPVTEATITPIYISDTHPDFWKHIHSEFGQHMSFRRAWTQIGEACSNAVVSLNDATETYEYNYGTLASNTIATVSNWTTPTLEINSDNIRINGESFEDSVKRIMNNLNLVKEKENNNMKFGNFDFGPVDSSVRMSMYGMAIKNASGTYVAYDKATDSIVDVDIFNFEGANKLIYKMPVAIADVKAGDIVIHARKPMFVLCTDDTNRLCVLDIFDGEEKNIVLPKSMFGFDFVTKVVSLVDFTGSASASNPFGNMLPLLMMGDSKSEDILPLLFMMNGQANFVQNPMLMYAMMSKEGKMNDILPLMLMCGSQSAPSGCNGTCAGHCKHK